MPDLTPEQEQERLRLIQQQNEAANELFSTYEKLSTSVEQLKDDEKELVSLSKQLVESSIKIEGSLEKRSETLTSIVNLSKSLNKETLDYNKSLTESVKLKDKLSATTAVKPVVKAPTLPETTTQTVTPNINVEVPELTVTPKLKLADIPELIVTPKLKVETPEVTVTPVVKIGKIPEVTADITPNVTVTTPTLGPISPTLDVITPTLAPLEPKLDVIAPEATVTPKLTVVTPTLSPIKPELSVETPPVLVVTPNFALGPIPQLTVTPNLVLGATPQLTVIPNLAVAPAPTQNVVPNLAVEAAPLQTVTPNIQVLPAPQQTITPDVVLGATPQLLVTPNIALADIQPQVVTPNIQLLPAPVQTVTPNLVLDATPQLTVTPNIIVTEPKQQTVTPNLVLASPLAPLTITPNLVLGPVSQLTVTPDLVVKSTPLSVTPNFIVTDAPAQTVTPNLVLADPLAPLTVTPNIQILPTEPQTVVPNIQVLQAPLQTITPNLAVDAAPQLTVTPNLVLGPVPQLSVVPNFTAGPAPQLLVNPNLALADAPVQTVVPNLVLGPIPQLTVAPNLVLDASPQLAVTPNFVVAPAPQQTIIPNLTVAPVPQLTVTPNIALADVPVQTVTPNLTLGPSSPLAVIPNFIVGPTPPLLVNPNLALAPSPVQTVIPNLVLGPIPQLSVVPNLAIESAPQLTVTPNLVVADAPAQTVIPNFILGPIPQLTVTPNLVAEATPLVVTPNITVTDAPQQTVTPNLVVGPVPQLPVIPNLSLGITPQLMVTPNLALEPSPVQTVVPNLVLGPIPQLTVVPNLVAEASPINVTPNFVVVEAPAQIVTPNFVVGSIPQLSVIPNLVLGPIPQLTVVPNLVAEVTPIVVTPNFVATEAPQLTVVPNLVLGPVPQINVTPNLAADVAPQLTVTPNIAVAEAPVQTVVPNLVLGPIPQLTVTPNLVAEANPISVTPNFVITEAPQQTVTPNLVVADPLAPLSVTPNLQLVPQSEPLFVTPRLLQKPVLDPLFVTPNFKLVPPTEPLEVTPNIQLAALSPLTVTPEIQVQTPVLTVTPEVNVINPTVTAEAGGTAGGPAESSFPFDKTQLIAIQKEGIEKALKKYERSPSLGVTLDKDKSGLLTKLATTATLIYSEIKKQLGITSPIAAQTPATVATTTTGAPPPPSTTSPTNTGTTPQPAIAPPTPPPSTGVNLPGNVNVPNPKTAQEFEEAIKLANKQLQQVGGFAVDIDTEIRNAGGDTAKLEKLLKKINDDFNNITSNANYLYSTLRDIVAELKNQNVVLSAGNKAFDSLVKTAQDINYQQQGLNDLTDKQFKKLKENIGLQQKELEFVIRRLAVNEDINGAFKYQSALDRLRAKSADELTARERARLKELEKEQSLLINAQQTLKSGIPLLQEELNLSKQISDTRSNLGGIAKGAGELLSKFGSGLSKYLNISDATTAVDEYNKKLVDGALNSKEVKEALIEIEKERNDLQDQLTNRLIDQIELEKRLLDLDVKSNRVKQEAVNGLNTFGNKLNSLTVFAKEAGKGITKLFTDPLVAITALIEAGFEADKQVTQLGKSFGISKNAAEDIRQDVAAFARSTGDTFINTDRLLKAQAELSQEMGISVKYSNEELATFAKLTELTGLSAQEAGKLAQASAAAGMSTEAYTDSIREGAFNAMLATNTHFEMKDVMKDISKLSAGTLVKFQGNPKALASAVVEAKKLGTNLETIDKIGDSLLNWESSIENELKAELMTGKQLNLEKARAAALSGDQLALTKEIQSQVGTLNDFQHMNVLAQQSLAQAFGMSRDEMAEMLMKQEAVNKYGAEAATLNKEQLEEMKRKNMSASEYIQYQEQQRSAQDKFADAMTKLKDLIGNLVAGPVGQLLDALANMVGVAMKLLSVFSPILNAVSWIAEKVSDLLSHWYILYPLVGLVALGYLPKMVAGFNSVLSSVTGIGKGIMEAFSGKGLDGLTNKVKGIFSGGKSKGKEIGEKLTEAGPEGIGDKTEKTVGKADVLGKGGGGKSFKAKMKDIAAGLKEFADVKVFLGALNLIPASIGLTAMIPGAIGAKILDTIDGKKVKEALKGIASGLVEFGKNNVLLGSLNLVVASAGLTAMIPGAIGAKILSSIDGKKLKESLKAISSGIESFGKANLLLGAANMVVAAVGLTAMIPGAIGAKIITQIDGKKFQKAMEGIAAGIQSFGEGNIALGALNLALAATGLAIMIPGAIAAKVISQINSEKLKKSLSNISEGIQSFGKGNIVLGALNLGIAAIGLTAMIPGVIAAKIIESINTKKLKDNLKAIADGIGEMGSGKTLIGALALPIIAVGLTTMIPGVVGAKAIEQINGKKLKDSLSGLAAGISEMGSGKVLLGSLALISASVGLITMIPGVVGAKLIELVNGDKFQKAMTGIGTGIANFGKKVSFGDILKLMAGGIALNLFAISVPGLLLLQLVNGTLIEKTLGGIGKGIAAFSKNVSWGDIVKSAVSIALLGASLIPAAYAFQMFADVSWEDLAKAGVTLIGLGIAGSILGGMAGELIMGAIAIALLGASLIPAAYALQMFSEVKWEDMAKAGVALIGLGIAGGILGSMMPLMLMGAVAIAALGAALIPFSYALSLLAEVKMENILAAAAGLLIFGAAVMGLGALMFTGIGAMVFGAGILALIALGGAMFILGEGLKAVSEGGAGIAQLFQQLSELDASKLDAVAPSLKTIGEAIMYLGAGGVLSALGNLLGGSSPVDMIKDIAASSDQLQVASTSFKSFAESMEKFTNIDSSKLEALSPALSKLSDSMIALGIGSFLMSIGGGPAEMLQSISDSGAGIEKAALSLQTMAGALIQVSSALNNLDMSKLEKLAEVSGGGGITGFLGGIFDTITDVIGGGEITTEPASITTTTAVAPGTKNESIQPSIDLTPMITAINDVKSSIDKLYNKNTTINMDGSKVGTTLTQGSYRVA
jgi:hypothetical protein